MHHMQELLCFSAGSNEDRNQLEACYNTLATERDMLSGMVSVLTYDKVILQKRLSGCGKLETCPCLHQPNAFRFQEKEEFTGTQLRPDY